MVSYPAVSVTPLVVSTGCSVVTFVAVRVEDSFGGPVVVSPGSRNVLATIGIRVVVTAAGAVCFSVVVVGKVVASRTLILDP